MHKRTLLLLSCCLASSLYFVACDDDTPEKNEASIFGRWELVKGFRNQKETETLAGVYFIFGQDGKMQTNLPVGADTPTDFEQKKNEILQKSPQPLRYNIQSVTDTTLVLTIELRSTQFEMQLQRAVPAPPPENAPDSLYRDSFSQ